MSWAFPLHDWDVWWTGDTSHLAAGYATLHGFSPRTLCTLDHGFHHFALETGLCHVEWPESDEPVVGRYMYVHGLLVGGLDGGGILQVDSTVYLGLLPSRWYPGAVDVDSTGHEMTCELRRSIWVSRGIRDEKVRGRQLK
jgi:hypothetical protein